MTCDCAKTDSHETLESRNGLSEPVERSSVHSICLDGEEIQYEARVGTLLVDTNRVQPAASMFYTSFDRLDNDGNISADRPVTFVFNGGPGSSTTFLLMGSVAPKRVDVPDLVPSKAPYTLSDNPYTILPFTDLVFIDAPGTGFSRVADNAKAEIWSVDGDIAAFSRFIQRYCTLHGRWNSPKYIFGESYGTTRTAGLAYRLEQDGVPINGLVMISNLLDYAFPFDTGDQWFIGAFPTYAAIAQYHGRAGVGVDSDAFLQRARAFAAGPLRLALAEGNSLRTEDKRRVAAKFAEFTGLSEHYVFDSDFRIPNGRFRKELLRDEGKIVGGYDGRVAGPDMDTVKDSESFIVDSAYIDPAYWSLVNTYLRIELGWDGEEERRQYAGFDGCGTEPGKGWTWWHHLPGGTKTSSWWCNNIVFPNVVPDLAAAIVHQPCLKVLIGNGLYDTCTPFFEAEHDIDHAMLPESLVSNIAFTYYPSGHMLYTSVESLRKFHADLRQFYASDAKQLSQMNERPPYPQLDIFAGISD